MITNSISLDANLPSPSRRTGASENLSPFVIETTRDLEAVGPAWAALETAGSAFQSRIWLATWFMTLGRSARAEPVFVTVRDRATGRPLVFFPFCLRRRWGLKIVEFPDLGVSDYNSLICAHDLHLTDEDIEALWAEVRASIPGADVFWLEKTPEALYGRPAPLARLPFMEPMDLRCWTVELPASQDIYEKTVLKAKDRKEQRRKRRNLAEALGEPKLIEARTREEAQEVFNLLKVMRAARFKQQGRCDIFDEAPFARFYEAIALQGWPDFVSLASVRAGGTAIAALMALRHAGNYVLILHSFAASLEHLSPGIVALDTLIAHLIGAGTRHCDFTTGNERYKKQFGVKECGMRQGFDAMTAKGRLYALLLIHWKKLRGELARSCGQYARILRRSWPPTMRFWRSSLD